MESPDDKEHDDDCPSQSEKGMEDGAEEFSDVSYVF